MIIKWQNIILILLLLVLTACVEEYWPDLDNKYQRLLVVEGNITNDPGPYTLQLSMSTSVDNPTFQTLSGYEAIISDNLGNSENLTEVEPGTYQTAIDGIRGIVGREYRITIFSPDGKTYQSDFEELKQPVAIDSVYVELEYEEYADYPYDMPGYQFLLNTHIANDNVSYYLWKLEQTYEYHADFLIFFWYNGQLHDFPNHYLYNVCWTTNSVNQIFTESTYGLTEPVLNNFPLNYVSFDTRELSVRYSLLVEQFTISEQAQEFWKNVKEQNTSGGELYSTMPFQVRGNLYNVNDPNETVLGYFFAAGVDTKRIFIDRPGYPLKMYYPECELTSVDYEAYGWMFLSNDPNEWPIYVTMDAGGSRARPNPDCLDCRENGGTTNKPEFWID